MRRNYSAGISTSWVLPAVVEALLPDALPRELRAVVEDQSDELFRQDLQDIVINQSFRRDIFCRSGQPKTAERLDGEAPVYLFSAPPPGAPVLFRTAWGDLSVEYDAIADLIAALSDGPRLIADLLALDNPGRRDTRDVLIRMADAQMVIIGKRVPGSSEVAQRFNTIIARAAAAGTTYPYVAAGAAGTGVPATELELLFLDAWCSTEQVDERALIDGLIQRLERLGRPLSNRGSRIGAEELNWHVGQLANSFVGEVIPRWRCLGVIQ